MANTPWMEVLHAVLNAMADGGSLNLGEINHSFLRNRELVYDTPVSKCNTSAA